MKKRERRNMSCALVWIWAVGALGLVCVLPAQATNTVIVASTTLLLAGGESQADSFQGAYSGTFTGTDFGTWQFDVNNKNVLSGTAHSDMEELDYKLDGVVHETGAFTAGVYVGDIYGGTYQGTISANRTVSGTWNRLDGGDHGVFTGSIH